MKESNTTKEPTLHELVKQLAELIHLFGLRWGVDPRELIWAVDLYLEEWKKADGAPTQKQ